MVDANNLRNSLTDPVTAAILDEIEIDIARHEQRLADLYSARTSKKEPEAAEPTIGITVSA